MAEEQIRLLACGKCKTIEVLDDYTGPPEMAERFDTILNYAVSKHQDGVERIPHAPAALVRVNKKDWDNPNVQEMTRSQIAQSFGNGQTGFGAETYAMVDNFRADALKCFAQHNRNPGCPDYKHESKRLVPDTKAERKEAGLNKDYDAENRALTKYLCEYCPVHSLVQQAARKKAGLYGN